MVTELQASTVGAKLKEARRALGRDINSIADEICVRVRHLEALEDDNHDNLPPQTYAVGFVRSYANALGLDPDHLSRQFKSEYTSNETVPQLHFPEPIRESRIPSRVVMMTGLFGLLAIYFGWFYTSSGQELALNAVRPVPERLAGLVDAPADDAATAVPTMEPASADAPAAPSQETSQETSEDAPLHEPPAPTGQTSVAQAPVVDGQDPVRQATVVDEAPASSGLVIETAAQIEPQSDPAADPAADPATDPAGSDATPDHDVSSPTQVAAEPMVRRASYVRRQAAAAEVAGAAGADFEPAARSTRIVVRASSDAWVRITDAQDNEIWNGVLRTGETYVPPALDGLRLMSSNAGGLDILVDGKATQSLGKVGGVVRRVALDPARLKNGTAIAALRR